MKKLLTLLLTSLFFFGYAQRDFIIADPTNDLAPFTDGETVRRTITFADLDPWGEHVITFTMINISPASIRPKTLYADVDIVEGVSSLVCFGKCYENGIYFIPPAGDEFDINSGAGESYDFHFRPNKKTGLNKFKFEFWTKENKSDLFTLHLELMVEPIGVKERNSQNITLSAYPNPAPANSTINVSYSVDNNDNRLVIRNVLGAKIIDMPLNPYESTIAIDATNLKAGMYFYAIENKNQIMAAKKLIIKN